MDEKDIAKMYGGGSSKTSNPNSQTYLSGLKITKSHVYKIPIGDKIYEVPTPDYIRLLEEQIRELRNEYKKLKADFEREKEKSSITTNNIKNDVNYVVRQRNNML